jgi:hypothetical protein
MDDFRVRRFATRKITEVGQLYGRGDELAATEFATILDKEKPDVVHLHAFTAALSLRLVEVTKARGTPVVFTYHTPTVSCQRGTLLLWGKTFCDGKLDVGRCAGCTLNGLGIYRPVAALVGQLSPVAGRWAGNYGLQDGIWTALRTSDLVSMRHAAFREMAAKVDLIVAVCDWVNDVLLVNDIPAAKVSISRHGINWEADTIAPVPSSAHRLRDEVRLAFLGRLDPTKGLPQLWVSTSQIAAAFCGSHSQDIPSTRPISVWLLFF